jgi:hypothetical protein
LLTPLGVGYLLMETVSVAFLQKGAALAAVAIKFCT